MGRKREKIYLNIYMFLERPVAFYPQLKKLTGSIEGAIMLQQLLYWWNKKKDVELYKTIEETEKETTLTRGQQDRVIKNLEKQGFLSTEVRGLPPKRNFSLNIKRIEEELGAICTKQTNRFVQNEQIDLYKTDKYSITESTTESTTENIISPNGEQPKLPDWLGKTPLQRIVGFYSSLWFSRYGFEYKLQNWGMFGKLFSPLIKEHGELLLSSLIIIHFNWYGVSGNDEFTHKRLVESSFPIEWLPKSINPYLVYLKNVLGVETTDGGLKKYILDNALESMQNYKKHLESKKNGV